MTSPWLRIAAASSVAALTTMTLIVPSGLAADAAPGAGQCTASGPVRTGSVLNFQDAHEISPVARKDGQRGGIARLATVLADRQTALDDPAITFGGDLAGGTLFGGLYRGLPFVESFNELGVDVASFGQHDFDYGAAHTRSLVDASTFTWITSNLTTTGGSPFLPGQTTAVRRAGDLKVGFLGLTGAMQSTAAAGEVFEQDPVVSARAGVAELEAQGVDVIVALTQIDKDRAIEAMEALPQIDALFREENSAVAITEVTTLDDGRVIVSPEGDYGTVEQVDLTVDACGGVTVTHATHQVDENVADDPKFLEVQRAYEAEMEQNLRAVIGDAPTDLDHASVSAAVADAFRAWTDADLAWINGGGVRETLEAGPLTLGEVFSVLPYGNKVMKIETTGAVIEKGLQQAAASTARQTSGGFPMPGGFTYNYDPEAPKGAQVSNIRLADGSPLNPDATYTLAITNYVYKGGNGVTAFKDADAKVLISAEDDVADNVAFTDAVQKTGAILPLTTPRIAVGSAAPTGDIPVTAQIPSADEEGTQGAGALALSIEEGSLNLADARNAGDCLRLGGVLPAVKVTDSRTEGAGWNLTGTASDLVSGEAKVRAANLGWAPFLVDGKATLGETVKSVMSGGAGLGNPARLAASSEVGSASVAADVNLEVPVDTKAGTYTGGITVSLFAQD